MRTLSSRPISWFALLACITTSQAAFWTYTSRFQDCLSTYSGVYTTYEETTSCTIKSSVTPTDSPYSTITSSSYYSSEDDLEVVEAFYSAGAVPLSDLEPLYYDSATYDSDATTTDTYHVFSMLVTYTAPSSCPTPFTITTNRSVSVPSQVIDQVSPYMVITSTPTPTRLYTGYIYETWYLSDGQAPYTTTDDSFYTLYVEDCSSTDDSYSYPTGSSGGGGYSGGYDWEVCYFGTGCTSLKTWVIIIASIIPSLFILGFFESYFWFRRLMLGKGCLRFGTISWICISLWVACFTRTQSRRSPQDQKLLREKWNQTSFGTAIKLWFKWGFRHRYPVPLLGQYSRNTVGIVPEGQPLPAPGMAKTYPGGLPPPAVAPFPNEMTGPGQAFYPAPQGWAPAPNGQAYPTQPGQAYTTSPNAAVEYYGGQTREIPSAATGSVSPVSGTPQPAPSPVSPTVPTSAHEPTPTTTSEVPGPAQLPTDKHNGT